MFKYSTFFPDVDQSVKWFFKAFFFKILNYFFLEKNPLIKETKNDFSVRSNAMSQVWLR